MRKTDKKINIHHQDSKTPREAEKSGFDFKVLFRVSIFSMFLVTWCLGGENGVVL
jgi:hypothetical protein